MTTTIESIQQKLVEVGMTDRGIPKAIDEFSKHYPQIICNKMTDALLDGMAIGLASMVNAIEGLAVDKDVMKFIQTDVKEGDLLLIIHCNKTSKGNYSTSVVKLHYEYNGAIIFEKHRGFPKEFNGHNIELTNIIAIAKVPSGKKVCERTVVDDDFSLFKRIAERMFK